MNRFSLASILIVLTCGTSCHQFSQRVVVPIPPPVPETLVRPLSPAEQVYYTLPRPEQN